MMGFGQTFEEYIDLGDAALEVDNYDKAIDYFTQAIKMDPDDAYSYSGRGEAYFWLDNYEKSIADYTQAIKIDPYDAVFYEDRGDAYYWLDKYEESIADYTQAIKIDPDDADLYKNRGIVKENAGLKYCSDFKKGCDLGLEDCCEWYYKQCK